MCDEIDDTSEFVCSDVIFVDSPMENGIANCTNGDLKSSWDTIANSPDQTNGWEAFTKPNSQTDGWEDSKKPDSQTDGWEASIKPDSQTDGWEASIKPESQTDSWEASIKPDSQTDGWEAATKTDSNKDGWEVLTKLDLQTEGWGCPFTGSKASKCQTSIQLSGWEASTKPNTQTDGWKASTKPNTQTDGWEASSKPDSQTDGWICSRDGKKASKYQTTIQLSGWEASIKADSQTDGWEASTKPNSNTDGWESWTKPDSNRDGWESWAKLDSQTERWVCPVADKKASKCHTTVQLSGWEASSKPTTQTEGWGASTKPDSKTDGWIHSMAGKEASKCQTTIQLSGWEESTKPDSNTDGWESWTKLDTRTEGWVCPVADKKASKCQTTIQLSGWEASTKPNTQTDGWEAPTKPDSQTDSWICSTAGKEASKYQTTIQLSGWEASKKTNSQTDCREGSSKMASQKNGWVHSMADKEASKCQTTNQLSGWETSTKDDSQTDGWVSSIAQKEASKFQTVTQLSSWEALTKSDSQTDGWLSSIADKEASRCQRSIQFSGWEASAKPDSQIDDWVCSKDDKRATKDEMSIKLSGWEGSTGWNSNAEIVGGMSKCGENSWDSNSQHDEVRNLSSLDSNLRPEGKRHCAVGRTKIDNYRISREEKWQCSKQEKGWKIGLQADDVTYLSSWNSNVETSDGKDCRGDLQGNVIPNMSKNKDLNSIFASKKRTKDYTHWNNRSSERIHQHEMTRIHDGRQSHFKSALPRFQKTTAFQGKESKIFHKNLDSKCGPEESGSQKYSSLPSGFSFQEDSYSGKKFSFQQNGNENTGWPSSTDILTSSSWEDCVKEESEHKSSFSNVTVSDNRSEFKKTHERLVPLVKTRSFRRNQTEAHPRNIFQEAEREQKTGKDSQATGWGVDLQAEVQETSSTGEQPILKSMRVESSTQDTVTKSKSLTAIANCHVKDISDENATANRHSSVNETNDKVIDFLKGEHSDGWEPYSESMIEKHGWEGCDNEKIVSESNAVKSTSADNLVSPTWGGFSEGKHDKCYRSFSDRSNKFTPTGANIVPLGTRSYGRAQPEKIDRNSIHDQAVMKVTQPKEMLLGCPMQETRSTDWTTKETYRECRHAEFDIQNTSSLEKETIPGESCHKPRTSGEDTVTPGNCDMETEENVGLTIKQGQDSDGWNQRPERITVRPALKGWHNEHDTYDGKTPTTSSWEAESVNNPAKKSCMKKGMEYGRTSKGGGGIPSLWSVTKDNKHRDHKNLTNRRCAPRSYNTRSYVEQTSNIPTKLQEIFQEINPLLHSMRTILHFSR